MQKDRVLSLLVVLLYLLVFYGWAVIHGIPADPKAARGLAFDLIVVPFLLLLPLALIWFGDELGDYTGPVPRGYVDQKTPGCVLKFFGWGLLLVPAVLFVYNLFAKRGN
jgi:hypothetical protein